MLYCKQHYQKSVQHYLGNYTAQNEEEFAEAQERINGLFVIENRNYFDEEVKILNETTEDKNLAAFQSKLI